MDIMGYLDRAADLERKISTAYDKTLALTDDPDAKKILRKISGEEINHANSLKTGKNYVAQAPDLVLGAKIEEDELDRGARELDDFHARFQGKVGFVSALRGLLEIEKKLERVHIGASVVTSDRQLKQLFQALTRGDHNHIDALKQIIAGIEGGA